jgi:hypothetical protein
MTRPNRNLPDLACILIVASMMGCVGISMARAGERIDGTWDGSYLIGLAFLVSLEALFTDRLTRDVPTLSPEWFLYRGVEWVVLLIGIRIYLFAWVLPGGAAQELPFLRDFPISGIMTWNYLIGVGTGMVIWFLASQYASALTLLEYDTDRLDIEREGVGFLDRWQVRKQIMAQIFVVGGLMVLSIALQKMNLPPFHVTDPQVDLRHWNLLLYFLLGFLLLGITNYSALRSRWYIQKVPHAENLANRWILYSLVLLGAISLIVLFLPTRYSLSLFSLVNALLAILSGLLGLLSLLILTPLIYLYSQIFRFFQPDQAAGMPADPLPILPPPVDNGFDFAWGDVLRSTLFWGLLIGIIGFSLYHYFQQHKTWIDALRRVRLIDWILGILNWLKSGVQKTKSNLAAAIKGGVQRAGDVFRGRGRMGDFHLPAALTPKDRVIRSYQAMVLYNQELLPRKSSQTPLEYGSHLKEFVLEAQPAVDAITGAFIEARYSRHPISPGTADQAEDWSADICKAMTLRVEMDRDAGV